MTLFVLKLAVFVVLLLLVAFFAGTETALTSLSSLSLRRIRERYPRLAARFAFWQEQPNEYIATLLVGTNIAMIGSSVAATAALLDAADLFALPRGAVLAGGSVVAVFLTLICGEIVPKILGRHYAEEGAVRGIAVIDACNRAFRGINRILVRISGRIIAVLGQRSTRETPFLRQDELKFLLSSDETAPLPGATRRLMRNILGFNARRIAHIMVPKSDMHAVNLDQPAETVIAQIIEKQYSRVPVYRGNIDNVVGIIYSRDLTLAWRGGSLFLMEDLVRPAYFVPGTARLDRVLREFKNGRHHLAIVVDEFGSTQGLVTIEDIVEELVGDVWDEYDIQEKTIVPLPDGAVLVKAAEPLAAVADHLRVALPVQEFATVGGWTLDLFGRIPKPGETVRWGEWRIEIVEADKKRIQRIRIVKQQPAASS